MIEENDELKKNKSKSEKRKEIKINNSDSESSEDNLSKSKKENISDEDSENEEEEICKELNDKNQEKEKILQKINDKKQELRKLVGQQDYNFIINLYIKTVGCDDNSNEYFNQIENFIKNYSEEEKRINVYGIYFELIRLNIQLNKIEIDDD